jgi:uridine phosphorylase
MMPAMGASYPNFAGKHDKEAFFNPEDFVAYLRRNGRLDDYRPPAVIILCYQRSLFEYILRLEALERSNRRSSPRGLVTLPSTDHRIGVLGDFGIGAPVAAGVLEDFIALGTKQFFSIGTAGSLQRDLPIGATVLCDSAVRDEGVSHHYLPSATYVSAPRRITNHLGRELAAQGIDYRQGASWTIDTPYRETVAEARHYQAEGVLCVEMEAAALFAVAQHRSVDVACSFVMSDSLADLVWDPQFHSETTTQALVTLYDATKAAAIRLAG